MTILFVILCIAFLGVGATFDVYSSVKAEKLSLGKGIPWYAASFLCLLLSMSYTEIDAGSVGVVKRFGNPVRQADPGLHFILPIIENMSTVATQTRIVKPNEDAASRDLQIVHTEVTLAYHIDPVYATYILVNLNNDAEERVINPAIFEAIKATTAQYDAQQLVSERPLVRDGIETFVKSKLSQYHIVAETTSITSFSFSPEYDKAIELKVTAQQNAEKALNDLRRIQIEAEQKIAQAKGEAEALKSQKAEITPELLQLRTIEMLRDKWDGKFPQIVSGTIPMLDILKGAGK